MSTGARQTKLEWKRRPGGDALYSSGALGCRRNATEEDIPHELTSHVASSVATMRGSGLVDELAFGTAK